MLIVCLCIYSATYFFFQAEDGIRDLYVTGVQTCALPISFLGIRLIAKVIAAEPNERYLFSAAAQGSIRNEIGRASCRERSYDFDRFRSAVRNVAVDAGGR